MADDPIQELSDESFSRFFETKKKKAEAAQAGCVVGAPTAQLIDGRLSSRVDRKGTVQLNVRVPLNLKNQVIELRAARKAAGLPQADVGDIVAEALRDLLQKS